ncbi:glycosyltransferase family 2 protein [Paracoccus aminophilus]|uniref:Dolichol-phosphate mannosyltransferase n=1 Tax=Paracoccus aminophilus JCM 7686 TaxID=1367847 RepID=S5XYA2_PARAH|nr:glycosyltransferase family 2 protein [Paracoccus aminophilus]AGT10292.1 dolichol-phosphate mannosyltransferase [Paracoccus aminophilus JCM 7686]
MKISSLSVVIPFLNEEGSAAALIAETLTALQGLEVELIVVNDGSSDATPQILEEAAASDPRVHVIHHATRRGQSTAIRSGVRAARHDWVATLDGDGQNPPDQILTLIGALPASAARVGIVQGQRQKRQDTWAKRKASRFANRLRAAMLKDGVQDSGCGLKLFRREAWLDMPFFDHIHRFTPAMIKREGWQVLTAPVNHRAREAGRSNYSNLQRALVGIVDLVGASWLILRSGRPAGERVAREGQDAPADEALAQDQRFA